MTVMLTLLLHSVCSPYTWPGLLLLVLLVPLNLINGSSSNVLLLFFFFALCRGRSQLLRQWWQECLCVRSDIPVLQSSPVQRFLLKPSRITFFRKLFLALQSQIDLDAHPSCALPHVLQVVVALSIARRSITGPPPPNTHTLCQNSQTRVLRSLS